MAKRKLNKNLIAGLTVGAMFALVATIAVGSAAVSKKDPKVLAAKAADFEKSGDLKRAGDTFIRAYTIDKEAGYLVEAARCYYEFGAVGDAIELLRKAQAAAPNDLTILIPVLERFWELRMLGWDNWERLREVSSAVLQAEPDNLLARACLAEALFMDRERDSTFRAKSEEHLKRANDLDATDPRVALVTARRMLDAEIEKINKTPGMDGPRARTLFAEARLAAIAPLKASFAVHPTDTQIAVNLAEFLRQSDQVDEAQATLEKAVREAPDRYELRFHLANLLLNRLPTLRSATAEERLAVVNQALEHIDHAIRIEPAALECYPIRAGLLEEKFLADGTWETQRAEKMKEVLEVFVRGQNDTIQLKSLRASVFTGARATMIRNAFEYARKYAEFYADPEIRSLALGYARKFAEMMRLRFPSLELAPLMEGWLATADGDVRRAIQLYTEAEKIAASLKAPTLPFIKEQLALLQAGEAPGAALKYTEECLDFYARVNQPPKPSLVRLKLDLLKRLERPRDAYNYIESLQGPMKDDPGIVTAKAWFMKALQIPGADELLDSLGDSPRAVVEKARLAMIGKDLNTAVDILGKYLPDHPADLTAINLYGLAVSQTGRREEGVALIGSLIEKATDENIRTILERLRILVGEPDPKIRDEKLLAVLEANPDECERAGDLLNFYLRANNVEKAAEQLAIVEKCRGADDENVMLISFDVALASQKLDVAEQLSARLARLNADRAGGAMFRGELAYARRKLADALREFRLAERDLPTDARVKYRIGKILLESTPPQFDEAIAVLKQGLEIDPRDFDLNRALYIAYEAQGRESEGRDYLITASAARPDDEFVRQRIRLVEEANDPAKGVEWRERVRKDKPGDVDNLLHLAQLYERLKLRDKADECMTAAMALGETSSRAVETVLAIYGARRLENGAADPAARRVGEDFLRQYIEAAAGPARLDGQMVLGRFYEQTNDVPAASTAYSEAERNIDEWLKDTPELRQRARVLVNTAIGDYYARNSRFADAVEAFRAALAHVKSEQGAVGQELRVKLIEAMLGNQQYGDAGKELEAFEKSFAGDFRVKTLRAKLLLRQKTDDKAMNDVVGLLTQALAAKSDDVWSLFTRARVYSILRRYNDARDDLLKVKSINRNLYEARRELARIYELMQNFDLAKGELIEILNERIADSPQAARAAAGELIEFLGRIKRPLEAESEISKFIAREPDNYYWHYQLGTMLSSRKEYSAALTPLKRAMDLTTGTEPAVIIAWVDALTASGRAAEAVAAIPRFAPESLTPLVRASLAGAYLKLQQRPEAVGQLELAMIAAAHERVGSADSVLERSVPLIGVADSTTLLRGCLKRVEGKKESEDRLKTILARVLVAMPEPSVRAEGVALAESVIAGTPPESKVNTTARLAKASALDVGGDFDAAIALYETIVRDDPTNPAAANNLAFLLAERKGKPAEALPYAERAIRLSPADVNILDTVGTVHLLNNNLGQAEAVLREAIRLAPGNVAANFHLGQTIARAGRPTEARQHFDHVLALTSAAPASEYRRRAEEEIANLK